MQESARCAALHVLVATFVFASVEFVTAVDCNGNRVDDAMDLATSASEDCNGDGVPDECELGMLELGLTVPGLKQRGIPRRVAVHDFDGDGRSDLMSAALGPAGSTIGIFFQDEDGVVGTPTYRRLGADTIDLVVADLDGNGFLDVVNVEPNAVFILWNDGERSFPRTPDSFAFEGARTVAVTDVDRDGIKDLLLARFGSEALFVARGVEGRTFEPPLAARDMVGDIAALACGDFDADGLQDVAALLPSGVTVLWGSEDAGFEETAASVAVGNPRTFAVADVSGDSVDDIALMAAEGVVVLTASRSERRLEEHATFAIQGRCIGVGDINSDRSTDVIVGTEPRSVAVLVNRGDGSFQARRDVAVEGEAVWVATGDLNGDGAIDVGVAKRVPDSIGMLMNGRALSFVSRIYEGGSRPHSPPSLADLDQDGDLDVVFGHGGAFITCYLLNDGRGAFSVAATRPADGYPNSIVTADFDGNGSIDVASPFLNDRRTEIMLNYADGTFESSAYYIGGVDPFYAIAADLNGDERPEVITADSGASVTILHNAGDGTFPRVDIIRIPGRFLGVVARDFDADHDLDLVAANGAGKLEILANDGSASFEHVGSIETFGRTSFVVAGDWDGDGDDDLAASNQNEQEMAVVENRGGLRFETVRTYPVRQLPYSMTSGDYNGDGHLDLVTSNEISLGLALFVNRGDGTFAEPLHAFVEAVQISAVSSGPRYAVSEDIDQDGKIDLLVMNRQDNQLIVSHNATEFPATVDFLPRLCTQNDFRSVAVPSRRRAVGERETKFVLPARDDAALLTTAFQNTHRFQLHQDFLASVFPERFPALGPAEYNRLVGLRATRDYYVGSLKRLRSDGAFVYAFTVVADTGSGASEALGVAEVKDVYDRLRESISLQPLAYLPDTPIARETAESWLNPGFEVLLDIDTGPAVDFEAYTTGVGFGRVRVLTLEEFEAANAAGAFTFQDVLVIDEAPRDIEGVVGGVITGSRQGTLSHVAVRTARRRTPNAFVADARARFSPFDDQLIRLEVTESSFEVSPADLSDAEAFWQENRPQLPALPPFDANYAALDRLTDFDLGGLPESRFGGKASNLARLQTILDGVFADYREKGFAIPVRYYTEFMRGNRTASPVDPGRQVSYEEFLTELATLEDFQTDSRRRFEALQAFRDVARDTGVVSPELLALLRSRIEEVFSATTSIRFRSSSNVEDLLEFNGAGLYESTGACLADQLDGDDEGPSLCDASKSNERTLERALKKVWTSLWTFRAHEERAFFQIPQASAAMGILVNRAFLDERVNGVAFTGDPANPDDRRFVVTAQVGEESVVSPEPGVLPEKTLLDVVDGEVVEIIRATRSTLVESDALVMTDAALRELGAVMWHMDQNFPVVLGEHDRDDVLLDLEFKIEASGDLAVKQVRPFLLTSERQPTPMFVLEIPAETSVCGVLDVNAPEEDPLVGLASKSRVRLRAGTFELAGRTGSISLDLIDEVLIGPAQVTATPLGRGRMRATKRPGAGGETLYRFTYEQRFSLPGTAGETFVVTLDDVEFSAAGGVPQRGEVILDEEFITDELFMTGFSDGDAALRVAYSSCTYELLDLWAIEAELADGTSLRLRERSIPSPDPSRTGPASLVAAEVAAESAYLRVADYWNLVYASFRHNTFVKYLIVFDPPIDLALVERPVRAIELAAPEPPIMPNPAAAYLDSDFQVIAAVEVNAFQRLTDTAIDVRFRRSDANADGDIQLADAIYALEFLFRDGLIPSCLKSTDVDDDGRLTVSDPIRVLLHLFGGEAGIAPPFPFCGRDLTADALDCASYAPCD